MQKLVICICVLVLLTACAKEVATTPTQSNTPSESSTAPLPQSSVSSITEPAVATEASEKAKDSALSPQIGTVDIDGEWTAYTAAFSLDYDVAYRGLEYQGCLRENRLVFKGSASDTHNKTTIAVLDIPDSKDIKLIAARQFYEPDMRYFVTVRQNVVLCQYGAVTEVMDEMLETVRIIELPSDESVNIWRYNLNDDFSAAVNSDMDGLDFENCRIIIQPLGGTSTRTEFSSYLEADNYHAALIHPQFAANGKKLIAPHAGFEFITSYVLMDLNGQNRRSYNHGSFYSTLDKMIGNDFYIMDVRVEREGDLQILYPELYIINTVTGEETEVYKATEKETVIIDYNENYMLLNKMGFVPEDNKFVRDKYYLFDFQNGKNEALSEKMCLVLNTRSSISLTNDGKIIAERENDGGSNIITIFIRNDK